MKKLLLLAVLALSMSLVSCGNVAPNDPDASAKDVLNAVLSEAWEGNIDNAIKYVKDPASTLKEQIEKNNKETDVELQNYNSEGLSYDIVDVQVTGDSATGKVRITGTKGKLEYDFEKTYNLSKNKAGCWQINAYPTCK